MNDEAAAILRSFEPALVALSQRRIANSDYAMLAQFRAAAGRDDEAIKLLAKAVDAGWLPDGRFSATDIADEPCFARLVSRPDFQAVRQRIFTRIQEERRKVPLQLLAQAYSVKPTRAAA
jgi:hypothetical protein